LKRVLEMLALVLVVAGIELATGALSHGLDRFTQVVLRFLAGEGTDVPLSRLWAGAGLTLMGASLLGIGSWARAQARSLVSGKLCPRCSGPTERVKRELRHRLLAWTLGGRITRRRCPTCGWIGLSS
jgi:hypothetical protein